MPLARPYSETVAWTEVVASGDGALLLRDALWVCQDRPSRACSFYIFTSIAYVGEMYTIIHTVFLAGGKNWCTIVGKIRQGSLQEYPPCLT